MIQSFPSFAYLTWRVKCFVYKYIYFQAKIDHGTHTRSLILKMDALQKKHFDKAVSSFLGSCTKHLLNNLPFDNQIIKYARFFQLSLQQSIAAPNAISRLTLCIAQVLGTDEMRRYFKLGGTATKFNLCDVVKKEFREYQTYKAEDKNNEESHERKRKLQYSCWKYAYGLLDIKQTTDKSSEQCTKIDDYWLKV